MINNKKRATETFLVAKQGQSALPTSGTVSNSSTGNVNLADGELGIVAQSSFGSVAPLTFMDATPTVSENSSIAFYQGTAASANVGGAGALYPLFVRPFVKSNNLDGVNSKVFVTKQAYRGATHNVWTLGNISSAPTGQINILDETEYRLYIAYNSRNLDELADGTRQAPGLRVSVTTPNFTDLAATYPIPRDWITTKLGIEINRNSTAFMLSQKYRGTDPVVAISVGLALSGPSGAAAGTAIAGLTVGTVLPIFTYQGIDRSITITQEILDSLTAASAASGFTHIFKMVMSEAGTNVGGTSTGLFLLGLDRSLSFVDRIPEMKVRLRPGLNAGFDYTTVNLAESVKADEGQGYSRQLDLLYKATHGQRLYAQRHVIDPVTEFPSPIVTGVQYIVYNVNHGRNEQISVGGMSFSPYREIICIPRYSTGTTPNPLIALFETAVNSWLTSGDNPSIATI